MADVYPPQAANQPSPESLDTDEPEVEHSQEARILLTHVKTYNRVTPEIQKSWDAVQQDSTSVARIFLDTAGFGGWLAYTSLKRVATQSSNFAGKAESKRLLDRLGKEDPEYLQRLANEVIAAYSDKQRREIEGFCHLVQSKRQRRAGSRNPLTSEVSQSFATPYFSPIYTMLDQTTIPPIPYEPLLANNESMMINPLLPNIESVMINPPLFASRSLFPDDLSDAIATNAHPTNNNILVGAISMSFPAEGPGSDVCQMSLQITHDKVQHFAKKWFGVRLEARDGLRYQVASKGSKILPCPQFTLQGIERAILSTEFGPEVSYAIERSPRCLDDARHVRTCTDSVSMVVAAQEHARAQVVLSLGLIEGTQIKHKLFAQG